MTLEDKATIWQMEPRYGGGFFLPAVQFRICGLALR
jgi:hypothetical protein